MAFTEVNKRGFIDQTFRLLAGTLGASRLAFYSVDDAENLHNFICQRMPSDFLRAYIKEMHAYDPLHVRHAARKPDSVMRMDYADRYAPPSSIGRYRDFLCVFEVRNTIDLLFRRDEKIYAGISVMWTRNDEIPSEDTFDLAEKLHGYIDYNLRAQFRESRPDARRTAMASLHLTPREAEVAELLCCGRTNADIADFLQIGISTVKTHLIHIFEKTGVENRSSFVSRVMQLS